MAASRNHSSALRCARGLAWAALWLSGCATYHPLPLPTAGNLATAAPGGVAPLDMNSAATVAVLNNPDLNSARAALRVAQAQAFAAGLLPDPHFNFAADHPNDHTKPTDRFHRYPEFNEYSLELDVDLLALLTHSDVKASTRADYQQAQLSLLWQEWQTVAQARTLYVQQSIATDRHAFLASAAQIYALAAQRSQRAQAAGNVTLEQTSADLAVLQDVGSRLGDAERGLLTAEQGLRSLLGVAPDVMLPLQPLSAPAIPARADVQAALTQVAQRRPDLLALQAGYRAEDARLRSALLSQFPDISIGVTRARDNGDIHSYGGVVNLTLPLFNRGRGPVAIERATRAQLRADYQSRLDQAQGSAWQLWNEMQQLQLQLADLQTQLPRLQQSVDEAQRAYNAAEFPGASYLTLVGSYLAAQELQDTLLQNLWSDSIALSTLLGTQVMPANVDQRDAGARMPQQDGFDREAVAIRPR